MADRGILTGTAETTFTPGIGMTRGMFVTALGRLSGADVTKYTGSKFTDVDAGAYYGPYVAWAAEVGLTSGTGEGTFSPDRTITRQELAVLMANYAQVMGLTLPATVEAPAFADADAVAPWAADAVGAMQRSGVMGGKGENAFAPTDTATRGEVAAVLRRFVETLG